jgi:hypothetical protein
VIVSIRVRMDVFEGPSFHSLRGSLLRILSCAFDGENPNPRNPIVARRINSFFVFM